MSNNPIGGQGITQTITVPGGGVAAVTIPAVSVSSIPQWMARLKMESGVVSTTTVASNASIVHTTAPGTATVVTSGNVGGAAALSLAQMDCYEDMFKEITKKLYGEEGLAEVIDASGVTHSNVLYDPDAFRTDGTLTTGPGAGLTLVTTSGNGLPQGTIVVQRRVQDDKGEPISVATVTAPPSSQQLTGGVEERWFDSDEVLSWTTSKIARYNPAQKVFRCVDCDFVGFLSRVAEHWLGNHASLRVFQCPRCPYTSAWARCVRMHLTRQHGETLTDNSLWKENPVLEEVTKFLTSLKTKVEQKGETSDPGAKRYACPYCPYATDRRDLFNRHENIHRDEKPFQCYVCDKQFNRADHVKKHFMRMHRDHNYDINRIRKHIPKSQGGAVPFFSSSNRVNNNKQSQPQQQQVQQQQQQPAQQQQQQQQPNNVVESVMREPEVVTSVAPAESIQVQLQGGNNQTVTIQQIPHIAYFNPPTAPGQTGPLQGIQGVGGTKKEAKSKGTKKKKSGEKMYTCSYCPWQGVDNWCLKRHLNTHIKPFLCALCDYKAARSERLATHVLKVHNKRVCHKCSFLADDLDSLNQHIQDSHQNPLVKTGFNCNVCQEYFELRADLEAHAILEHQKVIVQCDLCDFRTTDELSMESHLREKHNLQPGMGAVAAAAAAAAAAAGTAQPQMQQLTQPPSTIQIQAVHEAMPVVEQQQQQQQHHQADPAIIVPDQVDSSMMEDVSFSEQSSAMQKMDQTVPDGGVPEVEPETLCETCGCEFASEESYKNHEKRHDAKYEETVDLKTSKSVSRSYGCRTCSYTSATQSNMLQHLRSHTGFVVECRAEGCQFTSPFENSLKEHIHTEHNDDNAGNGVRCPHCGMKLGSIRLFTVHWRFHHIALCSLCVNVYKVKFGMKEAGIHDLVLRDPIDVLNNGVGDMEVCGNNDNNSSTSNNSKSEKLEQASVQQQQQQQPEQQPSSDGKQVTTAESLFEGLKGDGNLFGPPQNTEQDAAGPESSSSSSVVGRMEVDAFMQVLNGGVSLSHDNSSSSDNNNKEISNCPPQQGQQQPETPQQHLVDSDSLNSNNNNSNNNNNNNNNNISSSNEVQEPPVKKARLDSPSPNPDVTSSAAAANANTPSTTAAVNLSSLAALVQSNYNSNNVVAKRETLRFLPKLTEVLVVPVKLSSSSSSSWSSDRKADEEKAKKKLLLQQTTKSTISVSKYPYSCYKEPCVLSRKFFNYLIVSRKSLATFGVKCHKFKCRNRRRFRHRLTYHVHYLWNHASPHYKCDCCDDKFRYFYQAFLHKLREHPNSSNCSSSSSNNTSRNNNSSSSNNSSSTNNNHSSLGQQQQQQITHHATTAPGLHHHHHHHPHQLQQQANTIQIQIHHQHHSFPQHILHQ